MSREAETFERIAQYYDRLVERYGYDLRACDYGHPQSQHTRFRVISDVMPLDGKSVLDVGCGFAEFGEFLDGRYRDVRYTGIDISDAMIDQARRLHPEADIRRLNILDEAPERFDLVAANGIFYLLGDDAPHLMRNLIVKMFETALEGVAFSSLSAWTSDKEEGEFYADPLETVEFCRTLTPWVVLRHDYHPRDFTIYMHRDQRP